MPPLSSSYFLGIKAPELYWKCGIEAFRGGLITYRPDHSRGGFDHGQDVRSCAAADWDSFMKTSVDISVLTLYKTKWKRNSAGYVEIHPDTRIPDLLFAGPFTWDTAKLLFWLVHGGAKLAPTQTWEVSLCFKAANVFFSKTSTPEVMTVLTTI
jgi:hypothetical protein